MMIKFFEPKINTLDNLKYLGMALKSNFLNENNLTKKWCAAYSTSYTRYNHNSKLNFANSILFSIIYYLTIKLTEK